MNQTAPRPPVKTDRQEPFNAGDAEQVQKRAASAKDMERRRIAGLKVLVDSDDGRIWLWHLMSACGIHRTSFTGNSETFMREGQRNIGLMIQADLVKHFPESLIKMMREANSPAAKEA